jgi:hypothetical protein
VKLILLQYFLLPSRNKAIFCGNEVAKGGISYQKVEAVL